MLKVGIIGTGVIFDLNVLGYLNTPDVKITSLCNRTIEKAYEKRDKLNLKSDISVYSNYKEMLDKEDLDIVEILTPHHLHAEIAIYASQKAVKAISVQKPMALDLQQADNMITSCKKSGTILSVYENFYYIPHIAKAKELIDSDYIGDPTSIRMKIAMGSTGGWKIPESAEKWRKDAKKVGGAMKGSPVLLDNGWHAFAIVPWLLNEPIEKVFSWTGNFQGFDAPAYVMFKFKQTTEHVVPQYGHMEFILMPNAKIPSKYYPTDEFIEIIGTRGIMKINQGTSMGNLMSKSEIFAPIIIIRDGKVESLTDFKMDWKQSFISATRDFIDSVKNDKRVKLTGEKAREILKFNLAAIKSSELGREVYLKDMEK